MVESNISAQDSDKFSVSLPFFWIKGTLKVNDNALNIDIPNTILGGLIPAGKTKNHTPLQALSNVYVSSSYKLGIMILGIIVAIGGFAMFQQSGIAAILLILLGALMTLSGIKTRFSYERSGIEKHIDVPFFEAAHINGFADKINQTIDNYEDDRNVRMQTDRQMNANQNNTRHIVNAISNQNNDQASQPTNSGSNNGKFCPNCGAMVSPNAAFCTHCGTKLN